MNIYQFGQQLIETQDLDPVYTVAHDLRMPPRQLKRWLLAYWCFYHVGVASDLSEEKGGSYWRAFRDQIPSAPRGTERRHFRGKIAEDSLRSLRAFMDPENVVDYLTITCTGKIVFREVSTRIQTFSGFGPWIAWKAADMLERLGVSPVDFSRSNLSMYKDPVQAVSLLITGNVKARLRPEDLQNTVLKLIHAFRSYDAPPTFDRPCNIQEVETILCKYKSYKNGHYHVGKDIEDVVKMAAWGKSSTARRIQWDKTRFAYPG